MNPKLAQLLQYLDQDDVEELVMGVNRPISISVGGAFQALTPVAAEEHLDALLDGTRLAGLLMSVCQPFDVLLGNRHVRVEVVASRGGDTVMRIARAASDSEFVLEGDAPSLLLETEAPAYTQEAPEEHGADKPIEGSRLVDERSDVSHLAPFVRKARDVGASDLHISVGNPALYRVLGKLGSLDANATPLTAAQVDVILMPLLGPQRRARLAKYGYVDLAIDIRGAGRLRANIARQQGGMRGAFRLCAPIPPTLEQLRLPKELAKVVTHHQGLVVIAGPSGHGKTTTLAALVDLINSTKNFHIITIEDPVEIEHPRKKSVVSQREVGRHTVDFVAALRGSLREDPNVIVIGELRDRETVEIALTAAETGSLVLATMSTPSAAKSIDRLIDMFPPDDQTQVRASLAGCLRAIVAQRLLPTARGEGVVAAVELVTGVLPLAVLIRDNKLFQLPNLMQRGRSFGMIRMEDSLQELTRSGVISEDVARSVSEGRSSVMTPGSTIPPPTTRQKPQTLVKSLFGKKEEDE